MAAGQAGNALPRGALQDSHLGIAGALVVDTLRPAAAYYRTDERIWADHASSEAPAVLLCASLFILCGYARAQNAVTPTPGSTTAQTGVNVHQIGVTATVQ